MTIFLVVVALFVGAALGSVFTSMVLSGKREDQCRMCLSTTASAFREVDSFGGTDD